MLASPVTCVLCPWSVHCKCTLMQKQRQILNYFYLGIRIVEWYNLCCFVAQLYFGIKNRAIDLDHKNEILKVFRRLA